MHSEIITSIDIGSSAIKIIVAEHTFGDEHPKILSSTSTESIGVKNGSIFHKKDALLSLQNALKEAEDKSGGSIEQVIVSINGISFETFHKTETLHFKEKQTLITSQDIDSLLLDIEEKTLLLHPNNMCIDIVPGNFEYNRTSSFIKPIGVTANSLSASALVIMLKKQEFQTILSLFRELKKEILKIIPSIEAARTAILTKKQTSKQLCLVDIGGETISIGIYRDGNLTSYGVYPFGSENLTNTISKELAISYTLASRIKHGDHSIYLSPLQKETYTQISNTFIDDVFGTISYHIENIKTGATITLIDTVFIGGGSLFSDLQTAIKKEARFIHTKPNLELLLIHKRKLESIIYAISFGLILVHINDLHQFGKKRTSFILSFKNFFKKFIQFFVP